jgi:diadenosine tetraphosphatase ApaH/serine/threonine PP2A family protein phosphatase
LLADIHGNLTALDAVLAHADGERIDRWICLGDVVGYGPDPGPCIDRLRELGAMTLQGNHEAALLELPTGRFNRAAQAAIEYSRSMLDEAQLEFVRGLDSRALINDDVLCVHGSPDDRDEYVLMRYQMIVALHEQGSWICCCGHTHQQFVFDGTSLVNGPHELTLRRESQYLINPGSVGQPRDGDPRAAYAVLDLGLGQAIQSRVEYDIGQVIERIAEAGLPSYLGDRLRVGH